MSGFLQELKRRNVIRVAIFYAVASWLVLQVADVLFGLIGVPDWSLRLVGGILLLGFPFALVLAWAFELTPEGLKREKDVEREKSITPHTGRKLDIAILAMLALTVAFVAWDRLTRVPGEPPVPEASAPPAAVPSEASGPAEDLSIAVLPFVNMSGDADNEYFSDGLSEELLNVLAKIDDFRVAGRTSSFAFKGKDEDLRTIGQKLNVAHILEGSVRKQGDKVRVTAQLIDADNGYHLWSDTYDRQLDDIFAIQDEIASEVVRALKNTLLADDQQVIQASARGNVEAYNLYLKGQYHARLRTREGLDRALEEFQKAMLVDPDYAPSYAGVAMVYALMENYGYRPLAETGDLADKAIQRALELAPDSDEAWAARGLLLSQRAASAGAQTAEAARAALDRAIRINPNNALAYLWRSNTLGMDYQAMAADVDRAYELDPLHPVIIRRKIMIALNMGRDGEARRLLEELKSFGSDWYLTWVSVSDIAREQGRVADSALAMERALELNPGFPVGIKILATDLNLLGYEGRARTLLEEAGQRFSPASVAVDIALLDAHAALAEGDFPGAAEVFGGALSRVPAPGDDAVANLAFLEIGAGRPGAAEARVTTQLGLDIDELRPSLINFSNIRSWFALATALVAQGKPQGETVTAMLGSVLRAAVESGGSFSLLPFAQSAVAQLSGDMGTCERLALQAIQAGFRIDPMEVRWYFPLTWESPEAGHIEDALGKVLAEERARYDAAKASGGAPT